MLEITLFLFFPFFMALAAMLDLVSMTISNKISIALISGFCVLAYVTNMDLESFGWHWVMFAIVLSIGITLFALGIIGGGDAKFAAATSLWFGWEHTMEYALYASIFGGLLTILLLLVRGFPLPDRISKIDWAVKLCRADTGVPYGIALGMSALLIYPHTKWVEFIH